MTALAILHKQDILQQISDGKLLREVAQGYGISKQAIHQVLKDDPDYRAAMLEQAESMIEEAKGLTWAAREALDIARAREISKFAFRYAEAINPAKWSPSGNAQSHAPVAVQINIGSVAQVDGGGSTVEDE